MWSPGPTGTSPTTRRPLTQVPLVEPRSRSSQPFAGAAEFGVGAGDGLVVEAQAHTGRPPYEQRERARLGQQQLRQPLRTPGAAHPEVEGRCPAHHPQQHALDLAPALQVGGDEVEFGLLLSGQDEFQAPQESVLGQPSLRRTVAQQVEGAFPVGVRRPRRTRRELERSHAEILRPPRAAVQAMCVRGTVRPGPRTRLNGPPGWRDVGP